MLPVVIEKGSDELAVQAIHVVIVGFSSMPKPRTRPLWTFATPKSDPVLTEAKNISPYLADGPDVVVTSQQQPLVSGIPPMFFGSMPSFSA